MRCEWEKRLNNGGGEESRTCEELCHCFLLHEKEKVKTWKLYLMDYRCDVNKAAHLELYLADQYKK